MDLLRGLLPAASLSHMGIYASGQTYEQLILHLMSHPLPEAPWFQPGATRSARRVFLHIVAETAQHAGHADILRESLDGQKTMG